MNFVFEVYSTMKLMLWLCVSVGKLMDLHGEGTGSGAKSGGAPTEGGEKVDRPDNYEPPIQKDV